MADIQIIHGPNLNLLGTREPQIYGKDSLADINQSLQEVAKESKVKLDIFQSNSEGELVEKVQQAAQAGAKYILINAAGLTHTSVALRDALKFAGVPFIEVHLSNVFARESFRHKSFLSDFAIAVVAGLGKNSYIYALKHLISLLNKTE